VIERLKELEREGKIQADGELVARATLVRYLESHARGHAGTRQIGNGGWLPKQSRHISYRLICSLAINAPLRTSVWKLNQQTVRN